MSENNPFNEKLVNLFEPAMYGFIEAYHKNPILNPFKAMDAERAEDRFRDNAASLELQRRELSEDPRNRIFPLHGENAFRFIENPTFEQMLSEAQDHKYKRAEKYHPQLYYDLPEEKLFEIEKKKVKYRRPKYY